MRCADAISERAKVPAEMSPATMCTDQQMESLDGRKEARKFAKSPALIMLILWL